MIVVCNTGPRSLVPTLCVGMPAVTAPAVTRRLALSLSKGSTVTEWHEPAPLERRGMYSHASTSSAHRAGAWEREIDFLQDQPQRGVIYTAQGNALGQGRYSNQALKGRNKSHATNFISPPFDKLRAPLWGWSCKKTISSRSRALRGNAWRDRSCGHTARERRHGMARTRAAGATQYAFPRWSVETRRL